MNSLDRKILVDEIIKLVYLMNKEKLEELTERVARLEEKTRELRSKSLEQETNISELEEWKDGHNLNHSVGK